MKEVEEIVGIPDDQRAFAIFPLGYPAEERAQQDRFDESRIHFDAQKLCENVQVKHKKAGQIFDILIPENGKKVIDDICPVCVYDEPSADRVGGQPTR